MFTFCRICGIELYDGTRVCPDCKAKNREKTRSPYNDDTPKYSFDGNKKLDDAAVKAHKAGMSYGEYKMRLEQVRRGEITQEQLDEMIEKKRKKYEL